MRSIIALSPKIIALYPNGKINRVLEVIIDVMDGERVNAFSMNKSVITNMIVLIGQTKVIVNLYSMNLLMGKRR